MPRKLNYEYVKKAIESEGYKLLTEKCTGAHQKLDYICNKGHRGSTTWSNWKSGKRCKKCFDIRRTGPGKLDIKDIARSFEEEGYKLLTKKYNNAHQKLGYICPREHRHSIKWNHWKSGHRCPSCAGQAKPLSDFIKASFEKEGYILLSGEYINSKQKLEYICPEGHKHSITWARWNLRGHRCPTCRAINIRGKNHWNWKDGKTPENARIRHSIIYNEWRSSIFERDTHTCQICGQKGGKLQAHHIFKFSIYRLRRLKVWNGITLCKKCHRKVKGKENRFAYKFLILNMRKHAKGLTCYKH